MKFEEAIAKMMVGKKIKRSCWNRWMSTASTDIHVLMYDVLADDWEVYEEPKKPRLLAPAIYKAVGRILISCKIFESEEAAREDLGSSFISWPAVANKDGYFEVEE